jgi:hypothetical protein
LYHGIDGEEASQFTHTRKPVTRAQVAAENGQDNLRYQMGTSLLGADPSLTIDLWTIVPFLD